MKNLMRILSVTSALVFGVVGSAAAATWGLGSVSGSTPQVTTSNSGITTTVSGLSAANTTTGTFVATNLYGWGSGSGLGMYSGTDASSPQHALDNSGNLETLFFSFTQSVVLNTVTIGWSNTDADISVLRYTGTLTNAADVKNSVAGKTAAQLAGSGWSLVGSFGSISAGSTDINVAPISSATNGGTAGSSWWLVSAYSSMYGAGGTQTSGLSNSNDYMKILAVAGVATPTPPPGVPEPGSLALMGAALLGLMSVRRRVMGPKA